MYRSENAAEKFVCDLQQEAKLLFAEYIATPKQMLLTATELRSFNNATTCHTCTKSLGDNEGNLMYRVSKSGQKLLVVIHNLKGCDWYLIVEALKSEFGKVQVIPQKMEKYLSLAVGQLKFIDSFQFTPKGLDVPAKTLADDEFRYLRGSCTSLWSHPTQRFLSL